MKKWIYLLWLLCAVACREEVEVFLPEEEPVYEPEYTDILGFYLLNEGNMGSNKATLDYYDFATGTYRRNIYADANPDVPKELGDVGNDLQIYGSRMYAVINCSNKVEVMDVATARRLGRIDIPNCRYIRFHDGYAYVTSYAGPVELNPDYRQRGFVAKVDTATCREVARCPVGYQPDELEVAGDKLYVANSGGYMFPNYESTVSVIDLSTFTEIKRIEVAANLHRLRADRYGNLWVGSRGDYYTKASRLYRIDTATDLPVDSLDIAVSNFWLSGDSLYLFNMQWNNVSMTDEATYGIIDVAKREIVTRRFITDGTEGSIRSPYGLTVHPQTGDIYITDARNHISPGALYCFDRDGRQKWNVRTGDIPAHFVFVSRIRKE
ncbi:MAG: YncE family protein [Prevotellaceae bacterium]|jgi:DNA-binding beta-propeller fold protein YncE|nr:YncE family protein [Prevotellaceae bacterium]